MRDIFKKIRNKGFLGTLKALAHRIKFYAIISTKTLIDPFKRVSLYSNIRKESFQVAFPHEGGMVINLPHVSFFDIFWGFGVCTKRNIDYLSRPLCESLLRRIVFELYESGYINNNLSIVDVGCWIGDNSIVWAKYLSGANLYAIDPSQENLDYVQILARSNSINNICSVRGVCAASRGRRLGYYGSLDHTSFHNLSSDRYEESTTIDYIVGKAGATIGLLHVDVEGLELEVLKGSRAVISRDLPVIIFEQHISTERVGDIVEYLARFDYKIFMINEVLPGCALDCRNFLALPVSKGVPSLKDFIQYEGYRIGIFSAVVGGPLVELKAP